MCSVVIYRSNMGIVIFGSHRRTQRKFLDPSRKFLHMCLRRRNTFHLEMIGLILSVVIKNNLRSLFVSAKEVYICKFLEKGGFQGFWDVLFLTERNRSLRHKFTNTDEGRRVVLLCTLSTRNKSASPNIDRYSIRTRWVYCYCPTRGREGSKVKVRVFYCIKEVELGY